MCHNAPELYVFIFNHFDWCTRLFFSGFRKKSCQPLTSDTLNIFLMRVSHSNNRFEWKRFTCPCFPTRTNMRPLERHYNGSQPFGWLRNAKHTETIQNIEPKSICQHWHLAQWEDYRLKQLQAIVDPHVLNVLNVFFLSSLSFVDNTYGCEFQKYRNIEISTCFQTVVVHFIDQVALE